MATFNFYLNSFLEVGNYCGTITVNFSGNNGSLGYLSGGPCTGGANDPPQTINIALSGETFTGGAITIGRVPYSAISGTFSTSLNGWAGTLTLANGTNVTWQSLSAMAFPYGSYIVMVYPNNGNQPNNGQFNLFGGTMILGGQGNGNENVQLTVGSNTGNGSCNSASSQLNFGQCVPGPTIALPNGITYTFQQMRYAFTSTEGRAVLWGNMQISNQNGALQFVAIQWPALALPGIGWSVFQNRSPIASGSINFNTMQYTNVGGQSFGVSQALGRLTFTDTSTSPATLFTGIPQVTINGPGNSTNPSSHPTGLTWDFGGISQQPPPGTILPPPSDDGVWDSTPQNGQIETGHALGKLADPPAAKSQYA